MESSPCVGDRGHGHLLPCSWSDTAFGTWYILSKTYRIPERSLNGQQGHLRLSQALAEGQTLGAVRVICRAVRWGPEITDAPCWHLENLRRIEQTGGFGVLVHLLVLWKEIGLRCWKAAHVSREDTILRTVRGLNRFLVPAVSSGRTREELKKKEKEELRASISICFSPGEAALFEAFKYANLILERKLYEAECVCVVFSKTLYFPLCYVYVNFIPTSKLKIHDFAFQKGLT